jgi:SpoIID/LytB domain protein
MRRLTVLAAALGMLLVGAPAHATDDAWRVPGKAWITIKGHGYGHGHGMSQYGAEGAARQGLTYRQIAEFYYPGTTWGRAGGRIEVTLSAATADDLVVVDEPGLTLRDAGTGVTTVLPDNKATRWRIRPAPEGSEGGDRVGFLTDRWHAFGTLSGPGAFSVPGGAVGLVTPVGVREYRGRLWSRPGTTGRRDTVNVLRLESYLKGVVPLEMPALWSRHAVRAQAVAARTYAAYERAHRSGPICDTWSCQVYGGFSAEHPASNAAVDASAHEVLLADGEAAFTQFGSSSGGWTSAGSVPYLPAQEDPYDGWDGNANHTWSLRVQDGRLEAAWPAIGNLRRIEVTDRDGNGEWGGRVRSLTVVGDRGRVIVGGDTFRAVLGLRSPWVTFVVKQRT